MIFWKQLLCMEWCIRLKGLQKATHDPQRIVTQKKPKSKPDSQLMLPVPGEESEMRWLVDIVGMIKVARQVSEKLRKSRNVSILNMNKLNKIERGGLIQLGVGVGGACERKFRVLFHFHILLLLLRNFKPRAFRSKQKHSTT